MRKIAVAYNNYIEKFGIPRQSGLASSVITNIVFEKEFSIPSAFSGIEEFSHLWILWKFDNENENFSPTVRPPRLGGNKKVGVFATRSPFRPNNIGLSSVKLESLKFENKVAILTVSGADFKNGTEIYDIKPYITYTDCHEDAKCSFAKENENYKIKVEFCNNNLDSSTLKQLEEILRLDPRPSYQDDDRTYGLTFGKYNIKFMVENKILFVTEIIEKMA